VPPGFFTDSSGKGNGCAAWSILRGVLHVRQAKELRTCEVGSVAMIGVTGEISEVWQMKGLEGRGPGKQYDRMLAGYGALGRR